MEHICWSLLKNAFVDTDPLFLTQLLLVVEFESYQAGDVIIRPGVVAEFMYLIDKGIIVVEDRGVQYMLTDGDFFGGKPLQLAVWYLYKITWSALPMKSNGLFL